MAYVAADRWIVGEAETALHELHRNLPQGATLTYGRVDAAPLQLGARVHDLVLRLDDGGQIRGFTVGEVLLAQATSETSQAAHVTIKDLAADLGDGDRIMVAELTGSDVDIGTITAAARSPGGIAALADARLGRVTAQSVTAQIADRKLRIADLAFARYDQRRLEGLVVTGVEAEEPGRVTSTLAELRIGLIDVAALAFRDLPTDPLELAKQLDRNTIKNLSLTGLNLGRGDGYESVAVAGFQLGHLGAGRLEDLNVEALGIAGQDQGQTSLAQLGIRLLDWRAVDLNRLAAALAVLSKEDEEGPEPEAGEAGVEIATDRTLTQEFAWLEAAAQLARLKLGPMKIGALRTDHDGGGLALRTLDFAGYADGRFAGLTLEAVAALGDSEDTEGIPERWELRLDRLVQDPQLLLDTDLASLVEKAPRTQEGLDELRATASKVPWSGRTLMERFSLVRSGQVAASFASFEAGASEPDGKRHTDVAIRDLVMAPLVLGKGIVQELPVIGRDPVQLSLRFAGIFDPPSMDFAVAPFVIEAAGLGNGEVRLQTRLGADPTLDPVTAASGGLLMGASLTYRDAGMVERLMQSMEQDSGQQRAELAQGLVRGMRRSEIGRALLDDQRATALQRFLERPRGLSIALRPKNPVPLMTVGMLALAPQRQMATTLGLEITTQD